MEQTAEEGELVTLTKCTVTPWLKKETVFQCKRKSIEGRLTTYKYNMHDLTFHKSGEEIQYAN